MMTACECEHPGFCTRHRSLKTEHWFLLCQTRLDYFKLWEEGRGPGQHRAREPGLIQKTLNFGRAVAKHVATGLKTVDEDQYQSRLGQCRECSSLDVQRMVCQEANCGCYVEKKARWASEACPRGKWNVIREGEVPPEPSGETGNEQGEGISKHSSGEQHASARAAPAGHERSKTQSIVAGI